MSAVLKDSGRDRSAEFARLLEVTQLLRTGFERGEWGGAADLEAERRGLIERVFDRAPTAAELPQLTATLREVVRLNDELIGLAEHRRRALGRELDTVVAGKRAGKMYRSVGTRFPGRRP
jgi:translation initiation factor 2B subunit (eIF-2B alpha/beta/delta family)